MRKTLTLIIVALLLQAVPIGWAWQMERPNRELDIKDRVESAYTNGEASVGLGVAIENYDEGAGRYRGYDYVAMNISMTANSRVGITYEHEIGDLWWIWEEDLNPVYRLDFDLGDDDGTWIDIPVGVFRFYGGQYSAEYQKVWV